LDITSFTTVKAKVEHLLFEDLAKYSKLEATTTALYMSRTTLYRKLKDEQSVFSALVLQARINHITSIHSSSAGTQANSAEIAEVLGFKDTSSYYKFFKRCKY